MSISEPERPLRRRRESARALARDCNDFGAKLIVKSSGRVRAVRDSAAARRRRLAREIAYAYRHVEGRRRLLHEQLPRLRKYQGNKYLGDPLFVPVMEELNRRKAIAYTHPFRAEPL